MAMSNKECEIFKETCRKCLKYGSGFSFKEKYWEYETVEQLLNQFGWKEIEKGDSKRLIGRQLRKVIGEFKWYHFKCVVYSNPLSSRQFVVIGSDDKKFKDSVNALWITILYDY